MPKVLEHPQIEHIKEENLRIMELAISESSKPGFHLRLSYDGAKLLLDLIDGAKHIPPKVAARTGMADRLKILEFKLAGSIKRGEMEKNYMEDN